MTHTALTCIGTRRKCRAHRCQRVATHVVWWTSGSVGIVKADLCRDHRCELAARVACGSRPLRGEERYG